MFLVGSPMCRRYSTWQALNESGHEQDAVEERSRIVRRGVLEDVRRPILRPLEKKRSSRWVVPHDRAADAREV